MGVSVLLITTAGGVGVCASSVAVRGLASSS